jgi:hypothetical protein
MAECSRCDVEFEYAPDEVIAVASQPGRVEAA